MGGRVSYRVNTDAPNIYRICSSGVPIKIYGTRMNLITGHCVPSAGNSFSNNGGTVGWSYTSTYPTNAWTSGAWRLLNGSSYSLSVFSGAIGSNTTLPIHGGNYGSRPLGSGLCTSGGSGGQICRYRVLTNYARETIDGVLIGHMVETQHDSNWNGLWDYGGFIGGDSGGPCYYADSSGGVIVDGVVEGTIYWLINPGGESYYCDQLSGVQSFYGAANAYVG